VWRVLVNGVINLRVT